MYIIVVYKGVSTAHFDITLSITKKYKLKAILTRFASLHSQNRF